MMDPENEQVQEDGLMIAGVAVGLAKVGVMAAMSLVSGPAAALGAGAVAELGGALLERRKQRMASFWGKFTQKYQKLDEQQQQSVRARLQSSAGEDVLEAAWEAGARAVEDEKLTAIAALLGNSLSAEELSAADARRLLILLEELDQAEIIILQSFSWRVIGRKSDIETELYERQHAIYQKERELKTAFFEHHKTVFEFAEKPKAPKSPHSQRQWDYWGQEQASQTVPPPDLPEEQLREWHLQQEKQREQWQVEQTAYQQAMLSHHIAVEKHALFAQRLSRLIERGLLGNKGKSHWESQMESLDLTPLGVGLLKIIDSADWDEWGRTSPMNAVEALQYAQDVSEASRKNIAAHETAQTKQRQKDEAAGQQFFRELERVARYGR